MSARSLVWGTLPVLYACTASQPALMEPAAPAADASLTPGVNHIADTADTSVDSGDEGATMTEASPPIVPPAYDGPARPIDSCDPAHLSPAPSKWVSGLVRADGPPPPTGEFVRVAIEGEDYDFSPGSDSSVYLSDDGGGVSIARVAGRIGMGTVTVGGRSLGDNLYLGHYDCSRVRVSFHNGLLGLEGGFATANDCCFLELTKLPTAIGDTIEGTFSGVLTTNYASKLRLTNGAFRVVARPPP